MSLEAIELFHGMSGCVEYLYCWTCAPDGTLLYSNCPDEQPLYTLFTSCGFVEKIRAYARDHDAPYALGTYMGLVWFSVLEKQDRVLKKIHLLGPVFHEPVQESEMETFLRDYETLGMKFTAKHILIGAMRQLPVIFRKTFGQLALMLHYCVNGERLSYHQLAFLVDQELDEDKDTAPGLYRDIRLRTKELTEYLRTGFSLPEDSADLPQISASLPTNASGISAPLRKLKDAAIVLTAQCAEAAIDGGLNPETAYRMADRYMGSIEQHRSHLELTSMISSMYRDYLSRVQEIQNQACSLSREIQFCAEYVRNHPEEKLTVAGLAALTGYTPGYLSRKFREETGISPGAYIKEQKLRYGALLLVTTSDDLTAIADRLGFCSRSHFSDAFHRFMGVSPSEYRRNHS